MGCLEVHYYIDAMPRNVSTNEVKNSVGIIFSACKEPVADAFRGITFNYPRIRDPKDIVTYLDLIRISYFVAIAESRGEYKGGMQQ